jgi:peroxin-5
VNEHDAALARQFFESQDHAFSPGFLANHAHDLARLEANGPPPDLQQAWANEQSMRASAGWASEFSPGPANASYAHPQQSMAARPDGQYHALGRYRTQ